MNQPNVKIEGECSDISSEQVREYIFPTGQKVRIENPLWLHVSKSGGHRIIDDQGYSHYIPFTWGHLYWRVKEGMPYFVK